MATDDLRALAARVAHAETGAEHTAAKRELDAAQARHDAASAQASDDA